MATWKAIKAIHSAGAATDAPHILGFENARATSGQKLLSVRNGELAATEELYADYQGRWATGEGTEASPALTYTADTDSGFYRIGADNVGLSLGGTKRWDFGTAGSTLTGTLTVSGATTLQSTLAVTAATTLSSTLAVTGAATFDGAVTLGNAAADNITVTGTITSNLLFTDATYDIGASGATRPRDLFLSRNATIGGTLAVTGAATLSSTLAVTGVATFSADVVASVIRRATSDGADNSSLLVTGGGAADSARGAYAAFYGNEEANTGQLLLVAGNVSGGDIKLATQGANRVIVTYAGVTLIGTTVTTGASAGDSVYANGRGPRGVSGAGTTSYALVALDSNNIAQLGSSSDIVLPAIPRVALASLPSAAASHNGCIAIDTTNNRLVVYANGARNYISFDGTA